MKRKIIFGSIAILFAAASAFNIGLIQTQDAGDISLDAITIMAQANNEGGSNVYEIPCYGTIRVQQNNPDIYEPLWAITLCNGCELVNCYEYKDRGVCTKGGFILV